MDPPTTSRGWLVAALVHTCESADRPTVRNDLMRTWVPEPGSGYRTHDGRRRATWAQLPARFDLVEVGRSPRGVDTSSYAAVASVADRCSNSIGQI